MASISSGLTRYLKRAKPTFNPAGSELALYAKSDDAFYGLTSTGTEFKLADSRDMGGSGTVVAGQVTETSQTSTLTVTTNGAPTQPPGIAQTIVSTGNETWVMEVELETETAGVIWYLDLLVNGAAAKTVLFNTSERSAVSRSVRFGPLAAGSHNVTAQVNKAGGGNLTVHNSSLRVTKWSGTSAVSTAIPYFKGSNRSATNVPANANVPYSTRTDPGARWSTSNNAYITPMAGRYKITVQHKLGATASTASPQILKNNVLIAYGPNTANAAYSGGSFTYVDDFAAGDGISVRFNGSFTTVPDGTTVDNNFFMVEWESTSEVASASAMILDANYSNTAYSSANLQMAANQGNTVVPNLSLTVPVKNTGEVFEFIYSLDAEIQTNGGYVIASHWVDGVQAGTAESVLLGVSSTLRATLVKTARITGLSPGNHTFDVRCRTINQSGLINSGHSMMMVKRISGAGLLSDTGWMPFPFAAGWGNFGSSHARCEYRARAGELICRGLASITNASLVSNGTVGIIPAPYRTSARDPSGNAAKELGNQMSQDSVRVDWFSDSGVIQNVGAANTTTNYLSLSGVRWFYD